MLQRTCGAYRGRMSGAEDYDAEDRSGTDPAWFPGQHLPDDARRIGLTQHVPDGALLDFAGTLDGSKAYHRVVAWFLLVVFGLPVLFALLRVLQAL